MSCVHRTVFIFLALVCLGVFVNASTIVPAQAQAPAVTQATDAERARPNTQGAAGARAGRTLSASTSCPSFRGVHDPFCGKSVPAILGQVVKFLLGVAGALFLAMFVYGGAVWLTAGSSDRHEQARKTLLNASLGIAVVILSYTLVSALVNLLGEFGTTEQRSDTPDASQAAGSNGS